MKCHFCYTLIDDRKHPSLSSYECPLCGHIYLEEVAAEDISGEKFTEEQKKIIGICIRNEYKDVDSKTTS